MSTTKAKYPRAEAIAVVKELLPSLHPAATRLIVAGSLRRQKSEVGDIEFVYVPKLDTRHSDFFQSSVHSCMDEALSQLISRDLLRPRLTKDGRSTWGPKNKLAVHTASGIPIDFFSTNDECWWNYVVCRTGPAESNILIALSAQDRGWHWNPYGPGFSRGGPLAGATEVYNVTSERDVFEFVGLPYLPPKHR